MPPDELQRPRPRLRASAASMPRLSFRGTCVAAEVVASSKPGDGVPSDAGATTKPVKASPPSRWQRLPPPEHQQTLVREAGPTTQRLRKSHSAVLPLPSIRSSRPPEVQPLRCSLHPLPDSSAHRALHSSLQGSSPAQANADNPRYNLRGCPGYLRSMSYLASARYSPSPKP